MIDRFNSRLDRPDAARAATESRGQRPIKMPKNYDFSVRNVKWGQYDRDYILRTDAVWEKSKLYDIFYTIYKSKFLYDNFNNRYMVANIRQMPMPSTEPEVLEDWKPFMGFTDIDGCVWQFKVGPMVQTPTSISRFVADKEGDSWYMCFMSFQKFILCNDRSPVKLDEANLYNKGFWEYPCYDEIENIMDHCGADLFEPLFELYRTRLLSGTIKPQGYTRLQQHMDAYGTTSDRKVLHY
eukprot:CAMPEP_0185578714 /NCGR_PEP_ID=MMETSP0434-20130131/13099_1 /TAXON_ID=626734 ORGANISM="Favella taraikaensis, Strain Fe Narragansett Bay" /NCGR_SAMPLE_ID=MMETSP0434 /ASSEMBLY_ACC=CAM_ASM_000379 /LENGTH=238 /DNA_ID=CAMNT_0028196571 /DNA_START=47 /DNA_END=763 /DNA_ORIENTATION=+